MPHVLPSGVTRDLVFRRVRELATKPASKGRTNPLKRLPPHGALVADVAEDPDGVVVHARLAERHSDSLL